MHDFRDHCYQQYSTASACNYPSDNNHKTLFGDSPIITTTKQNKVLYVNMENMDFLTPSAPQPCFQARDLHGLLKQFQKLTCWFTWARNCPLIKSISQHVVSKENSVSDQSAKNKSHEFSWFSQPEPWFQTQHH